jgi:hypothetical protein
LELTVPFPPGARVVIFVTEKSNEFSDLLTAAQGSIGFWDNPFDDEDWNDAPTG